MKVARVIGKPRTDGALGPDPGALTSSWRREWPFNVNKFTVNSTWRAKGEEKGVRKHDSVKRLGHKEKIYDEWGVSKVIEPGSTAAFFGRPGISGIYISTSIWFTGSK